MEEMTCSSLFFGIGLEMGLIELSGTFFLGGVEGQSGIREDKKATNNQEPKTGCKLR